MADDFNTADVTDSLPVYGDGTYGGAVDNGPQSVSGTYGKMQGGSGWGGLDAGFQSVIDSYASMGPLPSSHFQYGGFGSQAFGDGTSLPQAAEQTASPSPSASTQSSSNRGGGRAGGGGGGGSFKVPPAAERWLKKHVGEDWFSRSYAKGHMPFPSKPGGGADYEKINAMGLKEEAGIKAAAVQNARNEAVKQVMSTLPTPSPGRDVQPANTLAKSDTTTPADSIHKASYWKEYYSLPPEARSYMQPGMKKAYVDIMEKALKSAGL